MSIIHLEKILRTATNGPLRRDRTIPYYFVDNAGTPVYLTGAHTWSSLQDCISGDPKVVFDYDAYIRWMVAHNHNFMRGWHWEQTSWDQFSNERCPVGPLPFTRTGPETALDGLPRFDCTVFNQVYFDRLRARVSHAAENGIYVSVMLFQGWSTEIRRPDLAVANPWNGHPFNGANNVNGIDGDPGGSGREIHTLTHPDVTRIQEAYVGKVIETVNDLDNVLYEIGNEHFEDSFDWQEHMVRYIHEYESTKPSQHPAGMTSGGGGDDSVTNSQLSGSSADWISPRERNEPHAPYCTDPPEPNGRQIIVTDTDHLWGLGGDVAWVWKSFCRGLNTALMDPYEALHGMFSEVWGRWGELSRRDHPLFEPIRVAMGHTRWFADRIDLATVTVRSELSSSGYCLTDRDGRCLIYDDGPGRVTVELPARTTKYSVEWLDTNTGELTESGNVTYEGSTVLDSPFKTESVLFIYPQREKT